MSDPHFASFEEFWPYYVRAHARPLTRALHAAGTAAALGCVAVAAITRRRALIPVALVLGYGPAWVGHFFVEGNRPATFQHPLWSFRGDFEMLARMLKGTMAAEVDRCIAMATPAAGTATAEEPTAAASPATPTNGHGEGAGTSTPAVGQVPARTLH